MSQTENTDQKGVTDLHTSEAPQMVKNSLFLSEAKSAVEKLMNIENDQEGFMMCAFNNEGCIQVLSGDGAALLKALVAGMKRDAGFARLVSCADLIFSSQKITNPINNKHHDNSN